MKLTKTAQVMVVLISAVDERRMPVMPRNVPRSEERKTVAIKGVQWALCAPMASETMSVMTVTAFSTST